SVRGARDQVNVQLELVGIMDEFGEAEVADMGTKVIGRDVLKFVSLIKNHRAVVGQNRGDVRFSDRKVGEEQMMIHYDNVRFHCLLPPQRTHASVVSLATAAETPLTPRVHSRPQLRIAATRAEFGAITRLRFGGPVDDRLE